MFAEQVKARAGVALLGRSKLSARQAAGLQNKLECGTRATAPGPVPRYDVRIISRGRRAMVSDGRLLWLTALEWSVLLVGAVLCGWLTVLVT